MISSESSATRIRTTFVGLCLTVAMVAPVAAGTLPWYVVAKAGQATIETTAGTQLPGWEVDDDDTAGSVEVGYQLHRNFGIQAGYHDFGDFAAFPPPCVTDCPFILYAAVDASFAGFSLTAVPRWPLTERFSLYGKLGVLDWKGDVSVAHGGQRIDELSDTELIVGAGAQYVFSKGLGVLLEYEASDLAGTVSAGASWRF